MRGFAQWFAGTVALGGTTLGFFADRPVSTPQQKIDFNRDVRPILSEHCWPCHGSDASKVAMSAGLRLDSFAEATKERRGYRAISPKDLAHSRVWKRISATDEDERMPPKVQNVNPLNEAEKAVL